MYPQHYKLKPAAYRAAKKRTLIATPLIMLAFAVPFIIAIYSGSNGIPFDMTSAGVTAGVVVILVIIRISRLLQKQKKAYADFEFVVDTDRITCSNLMHQNVDLAKIEVIQIIKQANGSYLIQGGREQIVINIPAEIEHPERLEAALNEISPLVITEVNFFSKYLKAMVLAVFGVLIVFIYSRNKLVIGITAPILELIFIWLFFNVRSTARPEGVSNKAKWSLLIPIIGILIKAFFVLTGRY